MANASPREVQQFLAGMDYPCSKQDVFDYAMDHGAGSEVLQTIQGLDREDFASPYDVSLAVRGLD